MVLQLHDVEPTHRIHTSKRNILPSSFLHRRIDIAPRCETKVGILMFFMVKEDLGKQRKGMLVLFNMHELVNNY